MELKALIWMQVRALKTKKLQISLKLSAEVVWAGIEPATQGFSILCSTD